MKILKTLLFGTVFILMLSYYYVYEVKQFKEIQRKKEEARKIFSSLTIEDIRKFTVQGEKGTVTVSRYGEIWRLQSPVEAPGDQKAVKTLIEDLMDLKRDAIIKEKPENYKDFGLEVPVLKIDLSTKEGGKSLWLGDQNPTGTLVYGRTGSSPGIFALSSHKKRKFNKGPYDLRDKTILPLQGDQVKRLSLLRGKARLETQRSGDGWEITFPFHWRADKDKIQSLLSSITDSQIKEFVTEKPKGLEKYGLKRPAAVLRFFLNEGGNQVERTLFIGHREKDQKRYYAKREAAENIFLIGEDILKKVPEKLENFRDRKLFAFKTDDIFRIRLSGKETIILQKNEQGDWRMLEPKKTKADLFEASQWANRIAKTIIQDFLDDQSNKTPRFGLTSPSRTLEIWGKEAKQPQKFLIGRKTEDGKGRYAALSGHPNVFTISIEACKGLLNTSEKLRDRKLASFDTEAINTIELAMGSRKVTLEKSKGEWKITPSGKTLEDDEVRRILWDIADLAFTKVVAEGKFQLKTFGLDAPSLTIHLKKEKAQTAGDILFGGKVPGKGTDGGKPETDHYYAVNESLKEVFEVQTGLVKKIEKKFKDWGIRP